MTTYYIKKSVKEDGLPKVKGIGYMTNEGYLHYADKNYPALLWEKCVEWYYEPIILPETVTVEDFKNKIEVSESLGMSAPEECFNLHAWAIIKACEDKDDEIELLESALDIAQESSQAKDKQIEELKSTIMNMGIDGQVQQGENDIIIEELKEDAVKFAEWIRDESWQEEYRDERTYSTSDLYAKYQQLKTK